MVTAGVPHKLIEVQIQGGDKARAMLANWWAKFPQETALAFRAEMEEVMKESQVECPWDYENEHLDGSPHLRETARTDQEVDNEITTYGSYTAPYAVYVHEILGNHHLYPTKAKFLEDPATRRARVLIGNLKRRLGSLYR